MKQYEEIRAPYLFGPCKSSTSIAAHLIISCDDGCLVEIVRYLHSGRCRVFISGSVDMPDDTMVIYSSVRRLPRSIIDLLGLAAQIGRSCYVSADYNGSALHLVHFGSARFDCICSGGFSRG